MNKYNPAKIEKKWQGEWEKSGIYRAKDFSPKPKFYCMVEFPYPSGAGLHVGHVRSYVAMDVVSRKKRMQGNNVLYPIGWDAFGLPTENYAIKTKKHPVVVTKENIRNFTRQIKSYGPSFDWSREINTTDPHYYRWTQWIFLKLYGSFYDEKAGKARPIEELKIPKGLDEIGRRQFIDDHRLAYEKEMPINWCPSCKIGLANEEVVNGACERCGATAERKNVKQWMLRITEYSQRLISDLDKVDYLDKIKTQQINWIGKSEGAEIDFTIKAGDIQEKLRVFTTRPDTIFGVTYMVMAPEHPVLDRMKDEISNWFEVSAYIEEAKNKSDLDRTDLSKDKTGVQVKGFTAINPVSGEEIPVWISDYVLSGYGTGAIMAVPAHDARDMEFAKKFSLPIRPVIRPEDDATMISDDAYVEEGIAINSGRFDGLTTAEFKKQIIAYITEEKIGKRSVNYKLRDWVFSRQHYWGEPIPIIKCEHCGNVPLKEKDLPLELPNVKNYEPTDTGESPLAAISKWVNVKCPICGGSAKRETDTMPNWAGSSWYFLRYIDPKNNKAFADRKKLDYWMPVDLYNGGMEHTTLHLLYSRFWHKFLYDLGYVSTAEPYKSRRSHGMIIAEDGQKMSKSRGNVVNPDDIIKDYGADTLRVYEMFMGPYSEAIAWNTNSLIGVNRFLERVWNLQDKTEKDGKKKILVATSNPGKLKEFRVHLKGFDIVSLDSFKKIPAPKENGKTFEENSLIKARYYAKKTGLVTIADDSGLSVKAMDGRPGVYCSRFAKGDYKTAGEKIFKEIEGKERDAFYKAVVTMYDPKTESYQQFDGICEGHIADKPRGKNGFGYDPIFIPQGLSKTFGECSLKEKNEYDHRSKAVEKLKSYLKQQEESKADIESLAHKTIKKITEDIDELKFNTSVAQLMIFANALEKQGSVTKKHMEIFITLLAPFAPHITEEIWNNLGGKKSVHLNAWPAYDPKLIRDKEIELVVQVNGKVRDKIKVSADISEDEARSVALSSQKVTRWFEGKEPRKVIVVKGKLVSIVL